MNVPELLSTLEHDGVRLALDADGELECSGNRAKVNAYLPAIRQHKPELVLLLTGTAPANDAPDLPEFGPPDPAPADEWQRLVWAGWQYNRGEWIPPGQWRPVDVHQGERAPIINSGESAPGASHE